MSFGSLRLLRVFEQLEVCQVATGLRRKVQLQGISIQSRPAFLHTLRREQSCPLPHSQWFFHRGLNGSQASTNCKESYSFAKSRILLIGGLTAAGVAYLCGSSVQAGEDCIEGQHGFEPPSKVLEEIESKSRPEKMPVKVLLYQYQTCPFCCKVRAFLDYYGIEYEKVEVNPLFRKEIKFSEYRKVPIAIVDGVQINDSSRIISIIRSHMLGKETLDELLKYYPVIEYENTKKKDIEYANRNFLMFHKGAETKERQLAIREEMKWRTWVDHTFVHTLSPNIYRTMKESFDAFEYFEKVGNFGTFERYLVQYSGAFTMYFIGKFLKRRYQLKEDVRQSMYDEAKRWTKAVGKHRKFMGGDKPNLADLAVYGVLSGIEGLQVHNDLMENTDMKPWYNRVKKMVNSQQGKNDMLELIAAQ